MAKKRTAKFEMWTSAKDGKTYFHYKAANGEKVSVGEGYSDPRDALHAIGLLQHSSGAEVVKLKPKK